MRKKSAGYTVACVFISIYIFITLAILCETYLIPSIERLCYTLKMTYDVAGATFMAAATSAPELFVCLVATLIAKGDIGIGTIIGSSVFNVLAIAALCGVFSGVYTKLDWWPITRDCFWYLLTICMLFGVLYDSRVELHEAIILFLMYFVYLIELIFDRKIQSICRKVDVEKDTLTENPMTREEDPLKSFKEIVCGFPKKEEKAYHKVWFAIKYPAILLLAVTTPSARSIYVFCLLMAIAWISVLSYLVTWSLTIVGHNIGVPDSIMGLTVLAFGTSVPEGVSSFIVVRKGYGSMAMCNAIGSNTFDIFICMGLPWLIAVAIEKKDIHVNSDGLAINVGVLILTGAIAYFSLLGTKFVLGKIVGWICLVSYVAFLIVAITLELIKLKPVCDIESGYYSYYTK
ncbi:sodium/potassium/calcium exchanger 4 [Drosophila navojoa]|uniref:sodium/potassium/calcium exchanger 4 n=1 Tax=Drosophila navojoa TaxID=7232 RepID=UPI0011BF43C6|nr:sodium/potassium/calcium exchanger 4 [Drosophila navojoa]